MLRDLNRTDAKLRHGASWSFRALHDRNLSNLQDAVKHPGIVSPARLPPLLVHLRLFTGSACSPRGWPPFTAIGRPALGPKLPLIISAKSWGFDAATVMPGHCTRGVFGIYNVAKPRQRILPRKRPINACSIAAFPCTMVGDRGARRGNIFLAPCLTHQGPLLISTSLALTKSEC